jgi:predicted TIM-barrel fold metal-dependent hydrolase
MEDFEIIDMHVHLCRNEEEEKEYFPLPGRRQRDRWATPERAIEHMDRNNIVKTAFMILVPRQHRGPLYEKAGLDELPDGQRKKEKERIAGQIGPIMREMNEWGCRVGRRFPRLLPFIGMSDDLGTPEAIAKEVELRAGQGAKGVKMHPGQFSYYPNDEVFWPAYEKCQELGLPILSDSGPWPHSHLVYMYPNPLGYKLAESGKDYAEPKNWAKVLEAFPKLTVILAHLGSAWWDERVELAQKYPNVYFDTSQGFAAPDQLPVVARRGLAEEDVPRVFRKIGVERIMFGTDLPGIPLQPQLEQILRAPFTDEEKRMILADNARRVLKL